MEMKFLLTEYIYIARKGPSVKFFRVLPREKVMLWLPKIQINTAVMVQAYISSYLPKSLPLTNSGI